VSNESGTRSIDLLENAGVLAFLDAQADSCAVSLLSRPGDVDYFRSRVPHATVLAGDGDPRTAGGDIVVDCRPGAPLWPALRTQAAGPLSLFTEVVAWFLGNPESRPRPRVPVKRYFLLCTPRSGSTFLCDLLTSTQCAGRPTEHLKPWVKDYLLAYGITLPSFMEGLRRYGANDAGVFGSKVIIDDLFEFVNAFGEDTFDVLRGATVFLLIRGDKAAQSISNVRSDHVGVYHVQGAGAEDGALARLSDFTPDVQEVFRKERWLLRQEADLLALLHSKGIVPRMISYEAYTQSRQGARAVVADIAAAIGVRLTRDLVWPDLVKLSAALRDNGQDEYRAFRGRTRLFSTRSEPWLGIVLGRGWRHPEGWGVRSESPEAEIRIPDGLPAAVIELLVHGDAAAPDSIEVAATRMTLPTDRRAHGYWRILIRGNAPADHRDRTIALRIPLRPLSLEEVVIYERSCEWTESALSGRAVVVLSD
jgi:LPS sulfotransferase NodH